MIKVEALEDFYLSRISEIKNLTRYQEKKHEENKIEYKDIFECDKKMADYLIGNNPINRAVVKVIEVIPEKENINKKTTTHRRKKSVAKD